MLLAARIDGPADAPALVLLGSLGATTKVWTPVLTRIGKRFRVVAVDHRGHGGSPPAPLRDSIGLDELADDVVETLDNHHIERFDLAGLSLGGMIALRLAVTRPQRVRRLGLFCTAAYLPPAQAWAERAATVRAHGMGAIAEAVVSRWVTPARARRDPSVVEDLRAQVEQVDAESYAQYCTAIGVMDQRADLSRVSAATLVLGADQDPSTPLDHQRVLADGIPDARLEVVEDAAHIVTVAQPDVVAGHMRAHFGSADAVEETADEGTLAHDQP